MAAKGTSVRQGVLYHVDEALQASAVGNRVKEMKHLRRLLEIDTPLKPILEAHRSFVRGQLAESREDSIKHFALAKECFDVADNVQGAGVTLLSLSRLAADERESLKKAQEAREMFRKAKDFIGLAKAQSNIGACHIQLRDFSSGRMILEKAVAGHRKAGDILGAGIAMLNLSVCYQYLGECENAYLYAEESVRILERSAPVTPQGARMLETYQWRTDGWALASRQCGHYLVNAYITFGNSLRHLGEYDRAVATYLQGEELSRTGEDLSMEAIALNQIGEALREKEDFQQAEYFFLRSKALFEGAGLRGYEYAVVLQSVGEVCCAQGKFVEASRYYSEALKEFKSVKNRNGEAEVFMLAGELYIKRKSYLKAIQVLEKSRAIGESVSAMDIVVRANRRLGSATMHVDPEKAREYLSIALTQAVDHKMKTERMNIHKEISLYYKLISDPADALYHIEQFIELQKEIFSENAERRLRNAEILLKVSQYKKRLYELETTVHTMQHELEEKNRVFASLAARIMEKEEFVAVVEKKLEKIVRFAPPERGEVAHELLELIRSFESAKQDWEHLAEKFLLVHQRLLNQLISRAPNITTVELQVCVLVRLGMDTKKIGEVLGPGAKVAFNHRQSIRNKLGLTNQKGMSLETFLLKLDVGEDEEPG